MKKKKKQKQIAAEMPPAEQETVLDYPEETAEEMPEEAVEEIPEEAANAPEDAEWDEEEWDEEDFDEFEDEFGPPPLPPAHLCTENHHLHFRMGCRNAGGVRRDVEHHGAV